MHYARPRAEVETEIRETIEQSENYKKELSDSGREAGNNGVAEFTFVPNGSGATGASGDVSSNSTTVRTEQKPNTMRGGFSTPQADLRRTGMSPNQAEGK